MPKVASFLRTSSTRTSALLGAPDNFDFLSVLRNAVSIKCAIAFGHVGGWSKIDAALRESSAKSIELLLGQAFFQTEPDLLDIFRELERTNESFRGRLAPVRPTFHPKVWVIETSATTHVIVGSANLSRGGFVENTECSAYLSDQDSVASISGWFSELWDQSFPLTSELCRAYRARYDITDALRSALKRAIDDASDELEMTQFAWRRTEAIEEARRYFKTSAGLEAAQLRLQALDRIRRCLKPPTFEFTKADWLEFLRIPEFGSLKRIDRDTANHIPKIRKAFLHLANESIPLATRINDVVPLCSRYHVDNIGKNIVTKLMAMLRPKERPVYNERVENTLIAFGYPLGGSKTFGQQYEAFCRDIQSFAKGCGFSEVLSIDSFFEYYSRKRMKKR
jgi:HKD family nuclease